jgi:hypothetical protein
MSDEHGREDRAADGGHARYGRGSGGGSGNNEPKRHERKEQRPDWIHRQGGDQTRPGDAKGSHD